MRTISIAKALVDSDKGDISQSQRTQTLNLHVCFTGDTSLKKSKTEFMMQGCSVKTEIELTCLCE